MFGKKEKKSVWKEIREILYVSKEIGKLCLERNKRNMFGKK